MIANLTAQHCLGIIADHKDSQQSVNIATVSTGRDCLYKHGESTNKFIQLKAKHAAETLPLEAEQAAQALQP